MKSPNDIKWRDILKAHDPATRPDATMLAALEYRIMDRVAAIQDRLIPAGVPVIPWLLGGGWIARGACLAAVLFVLLGFLVGREFDNLSFQTANTNVLFASATSTPWQSFITSPASGDTDDVQ